MCFPSKATKILVVRTIAQMYIKIQVEKWMDHRLVHRDTGKKQNDP